MSEDARGGWWTTLPGLLTAAAALLTAVTGLAVALNQMGVVGEPSEPGSATVSTSSETPTPDAAEVAPTPSLASTPEEEGETNQGEATGQAGPTEQKNQTFDSTLPLNRPIRLGNVSYEILRSTIEPEADGQLAVRLTVRMKCYSDYGANFWDNSFRIAVGEDRYPASGGLNEVVEGQATKRGEVVILVPESARTAELLLRYQDSNKTVPFTIRAHGA
jgi:hypothetical protein